MSRKNIALLALEGEENVEDQLVTDERVEAEDLQQLEETDREIETDQIAIEEAEETAEAIGELAEQVEEESAEEKEGITEETAEAIEVAVEHFCARVGYARKKISLATESFGTESRKEKSVQLAKDLRIAQESIEKQLVIAQEGLWDKVKTKLDQVFTSTKKLKAQAAVAAKELEAKGSKEGMIENKYLTTYLNLENKQELTGKDVVAALAKVSGIISNEKLIALANKVDKLSNEVMSAMASSTFIAKDEQVAKINEMTKELQDVRHEVEALLSGVKKGTEVSIKPAQAAEGKKINDEVFDLLGKKDNGEAVQKILASWQKANWVGAGESQIRLAGAWAADMRAARRAQQEVGEMYWLIADLQSMAFKMSHAAVRYVELSTAK